jgi:hypothetical protein
MAQADSISALSQEIEAGIGSLRTPRQTHFQANPSTPANATGEVNRVAAHRHIDGATYKFVPLNDTTGRPKRVFRKTPPPPKNRRKSASEIGAAAPHPDEIFGSARLKSFELLNDALGSPKRALTPPLSRSNASEASTGQVDSEQAGAAGKRELSFAAKQTLLDCSVLLCKLPSGSAPENAGAGVLDFADCGWRNHA